MRDMEGNSELCLETQLANLHGGSEQEAQFLYVRSGDLAKRIRN